MRDLTLTEDTEQSEEAPWDGGGGLNLSALRREREQGPAWLPKVLEAIKATGTEGMKPSAVAELVGKDRKTVRAALQAAVDGASWCTGTTARTRSTSTSTMPERLHRALLSTG
ncbi:hypothetical protein ACFV2N_44775 [Streptomyces sp. NPDC059680]|uniref:hypothetical protein n=1 Tax=Streptomyces sp. NPDC059680 TaxID=3346904 RepID=UPI0036975307